MVLVYSQRQTVNMRMYSETVVVLVYSQRQTVNMRMSRDQGLEVAFVVCISRLNGKEGFMAKSFDH